jgi:membrane-associated PAP2 superfamily phosphatase
MGRFGMAGGMSIFNLAEVLQGFTIIPSSLWCLDYLWIPALIFGYYFVYRNPPRSMGDLMCKSLGLALIFFLTRL